MIDNMLGYFIMTCLFIAMYILELYGAIFVSILFGGFVYFVGNSRKYEFVNKFIDSF